MKPYCSQFPKNLDDRIREDIRRQLMWQTDIQSEEIEVAVNDSAVTLSGRVETRLERMEAEKATKAVYGVSSIKNNIRVEPKRMRSDHEVEEDIAAGLRMMLSVLEEVPMVSVRDGITTLEGKLRWHFQRTSAERVADAVIGTRLVRNLIEIAPKADSRTESHVEQKRGVELRLQPQRATVPGALLLQNGNNGHSRAV
jgi:osmotically-inducible protein OsmY